MFEQKEVYRLEIVIWSLDVYRSLSKLLRPLRDKKEILLDHYGRFEWEGKEYEIYGMAITTKNREIHWGMLDLIEEEQGKGLLEYRERYDFK